VKRGGTLSKRALLPTTAVLLGMHGIEEVVTKFADHDRFVGILAGALRVPPTAVFVLLQCAWIGALVGLGRPHHVSSRLRTGVVWAVSLFELVHPIEAVRRHAYKESKASALSSRIEGFLNKWDCTNDHLHAPGSGFSIRLPHPP
jgi:hypothetical protein